MKNLKYTKWMILVITLALVFTSCTTDDSDVIENSNYETRLVLTEIEENALIFMMEEERLARDVYNVLYAKWGLNQFQNIAKSEQSHMDAVENLLKKYNLEYDILDAGTFKNEDLQTTYNSLVEQGEISILGALTSGATIEDLDIFDLEEWMLKVDNGDILNVFSKLQCGSRNHLRAFTNSLELQGEIYVPQFISQTDYEEIITNDRERCN
jgi:hypothetical protein